MRLSLVVLSVLLTGSLAAAQSMPLTIKGHTIGESIAEYVLETPGGAQQLKNCRTAIADPKKAGKQEANLAACRALVSAVDLGARSEISMGPAGLLGKATFDAGVLVKLELNIGAEENSRNAFLPYSQQRPGPSFDEVIKDLTNRIGNAGTSSDLVMQNGFGATFHHLNVEWDGSKIYADAFEALAGGIESDGRIRSDCHNGDGGNTRGATESIAGSLLET